MRTRSGPPTALARFLIYTLSYAESLGLDRGQLLAASEVTEQDLADPDVRISVSKHMRLWRFLLQKLEDPGFGVRMGSLFRVQHLGLVGYTMLHSASLEGAIRRLVRYERIMSDEFHLDLRPQSSGAVLVITTDPLWVALHQPLATYLASAVALLRQVTGRRIAPVETCFPYSAPPDASAYQEHFEGRVLFEQRESSLAFRSTDLSLPVLASDPTLCAYLDRHAEEVRKALPARATWTAQVQEVLWNRLSGGQATMERVAAALDMSSRTMQRRLREEGSSFAAVLDSMRKGMALRLLRDPNLTANEIAFLLGYSEPSTFFRAFRRWTNTSPSDYRAARRAVN